MSVTKEIVHAAIVRLRHDDFLFRCIRDQWISDETFLEAIKTLDSINSSLEFTMKNLNHGLSNDKEWKTQKNNRIVIDADLCTSVLPCTSPQPLPCKQ